MINGSYSYEYGIWKYYLKEVFKNSPEIREKFLKIIYNG